MKNKSRFCAFLRGVNVNGTAMKMAEVCKVFSDAGMEEVSSVLATGNILFTSDRKVSDLKPMLEKAMSQHFNYEAFLFIKERSEVLEIFEKVPFESSRENHIYVFVGTSSVENTLMEEFIKSNPQDNEKAEISGNTFYWQVPKGNTLDSAFGKILGRKSLKDQMTSRNINTLEKIVKKL